MGVPSYFLWLVKKFEERILLPVDSTVLTKSPDNLFLDWNCGIHPAVKKHNLRTLEQKLDAVLKYLDDIYYLVQPKKLIYIAMDGVAPRAKMQQQRKRRFKSVQDAKYIKILKERHNIPLSEEAEWDYNMISPGTIFMDLLSKKITAHISTWNSKCKVILSDSNQPGEGEHKIMQYIRDNVAFNDYNIIYGLDSDLIFLSLINFRPNMTLLREQVEFGDKFKQLTDTKIKWVLLKLEELREVFLQIFNPYLSLRELEGFGIFGTTPLDELTSPYYTDNQFQDQATAMIQKGFYCNPASEGKNLIIDYIFMSFMLGNDFLPPIVSLQIKEGGLDHLIRAYKMTQIVLHQYLVLIDEKRPDSFKINMTFFTRLLEICTAMESHILKGMTKHRLHRINGFERSRKYQDASPYERDLLILDYVENKMPDFIQLGEHGWSSRYYQIHFRLNDRNPHESRKYIMNICEHYVRGMIWTMQYYLTGKSDWQWEYPFHSSPTIHDLLEYTKKYSHNISKIQHELQITSKTSQPVSPLEQLLCILPPESKHLLPTEIAKLMDDNSHLSVYYPKDFSLDIFGHRYRWEAHPLLPNIPISEISAAVKSLLPTLTEDEIQRNTNK